MSTGQIVPTYDGVKVDTWAMGITLHILLRGDYPFGGLMDGLKMTKAGTLSAELLRKLDQRVEVTPECRDFLKQCLIFDSAARPTVQALCAHPWLNGCGAVVRPAPVCLSDAQISE